MVHRLTPHTGLPASTASAGSEFDRKADSSRSRGLLSNSELTDAVDGGSPLRGVSLCSVRETTQSWVKVPKYGLSAIEGGPEP